jgi:hypothetical protein
MKIGKVTMASLTWVFTANLLVYFGLLGYQVNYEKVRTLWAVDMEYENNLPDRLRKDRDR